MYKKKKKSWNGIHQSWNGIYLFCVRVGMVMVLVQVIPYTSLFE